jgi:hypothetical protein
MTVALRKFLKHFQRYRDLAESGAAIEVQGRDGKRFVFVAQKPRRAFGAGKHLAQGKPLFPEPTPRSEWGGVWA